MEIAVNVLIACLYIGMQDYIYSPGIYTVYSINTSLRIFLTKPPWSCFKSVKPQTLATSNVGSTPDKSHGTFGPRNLSDVKIPFSVFNLHVYSILEWNLVAKEAYLFKWSDCQSYILYIMYNIYTVHVHAPKKLRKFIYIHIYILIYSRKWSRYLILET